MADSLPDPDPDPDPDPKADADADTGVVPSRRPAAGMPRWVKVLGIAAAVLALLIVIVMFVGGGSHGPGRHLSPAGVTEDHAPPGAGPGGHAPPEGGH